MKLLLTLGLLCSAAAFAQQPKPAPTVAGSMNWIFGVEAREFIAAADAMPEDKWNFIPATGDFKGVRTFAGQVWHVACANEGFAAELEGQKPPEHCEALGPGPDEHASKDKLMAYLRMNFERMQRDIDALTPANMLEEIDTMYPGGRRTRLAIAATAVYHAADHFGQIVEYLRLNGIVPPSSRPRQQAESSQPSAPPATPVPTANTVTSASKFGLTDGEVAASPATSIQPGVAQGRLIHRVDPQYPYLARVSRVQGDVVLQGTIAKDGSVKDLRLVSGDACLAVAAMQAVYKWKYSPYQVEGKPVEVSTTITVHFTLTQR